MNIIYLLVCVLLVAGFVLSGISLAKDLSQKKNTEVYKSLGTVALLYFGGFIVVSADHIAERLYHLIPLNFTSLTYLCYALSFYCFSYVIYYHYRLNEQRKV